MNRIDKLPLSIHVPFKNSKSGDTETILSYAEEVQIEEINLEFRNVEG